MRLTCVIVLIAALLAQPLAVAANDGTDGVSAWAPGAERRYARTLDKLKLKKTARPGEHRVVGDGTGRWGNVSRVFITGDGTLWVETGMDMPELSLFRAGVRGGWSTDSAPPLTGSTPLGMTARRGEDRFAIYRKGKWRWSPQWPEESLGFDLSVGDDGTAWVAGPGNVAHFDGTSWTSWSIDDLGLTFTLPFGEGWISGLGVTPDGSTWAGVADRDTRPAGLARFDGGVWAQVTPVAGDEHIAVTDLDVGADGTLWALLVPDRDHARAHLVRWDGEAWAAWDLPSWLGEWHGLPFGLQGAPDGRAWMRVFRTEEDATDYQARAQVAWIVFDGESWTHLDIRGGGYDHLSFAPDGTVWVGDLVWSSEDRQRVYVTDPSKVEPLAVETAQTYEPAADPSSG